MPEAAIQCCPSPKHSCVPVSLNSTPLLPLPVPCCQEHWLLGYFPSKRNTYPGTRLYGQALRHKFLDHKGKGPFKSWTVHSALSERLCPQHSVCFHPTGDNNSLCPQQSLIYKTLLALLEKEFPAPGETISGRMGGET